MNAFSANVEEITPEKAAEYLAANHNNRKIREKAVAPLLADIQTGNWRLTGESIKFDQSNRLIDGQHRLTAIERSGQTVPLLVVRGVGTETQTVIDTGLKRTGADALEMEGRGHEATLRAAVAAIGLTDDAGKFNLSNSKLLPATHSQIIEWVKNNNLNDAIVWGGRVHRTLRGSKSSIVYAFYKISQVDLQSAKDFFDAIADLNTGGPGDPKHTLVNKLNKSRDYFKGSGYRARYVYHFLKAWEADYLGQDLRLIRDTIRDRPLDMPDLSRYMKGEVITGADAEA